MSSIPPVQSPLPFEWKPCCRCHQVKPLSDFSRDRLRADGLAAQCKPCIREIKRNWKADLSPAQLEALRATKRREIAAYRRRIGPQVETERRRERMKRYRGTPEEQARRVVRKAVRSGRLEKPDACQQCAAPTTRRNLHGHHEDYAKPMEVVWLCPLCHGRTWRKR